MAIIHVVEGGVAVNAILVVDSAVISGGGAGLTVDGEPYLAAPPGATFVKADGAQIGWIVSGATLVAPPPPAPPAMSAAELAAYAHARQAAVMSGGISVNVGTQSVEASTDTASLVLLQGAAAIAAAEPSTSFAWVQASGPVTLTAAEIATIFSAVAAFVQATFAALGAVLTAIAAGSTTTAAEIDAAAWPANS